VLKFKYPATGSELKKFHLPPIMYLHELVFNCWLLFMLQLGLYTTACLINHSATFTVLFLFSKHSQWSCNTSPTAWSLTYLNLLWSVMHWTSNMENVTYQTGIPLTMQGQNAYSCGKRFHAWQSYIQCDGSYSSSHNLYRNKHRVNHNLSHYHFSPHIQSTGFIY
jgi:hypothetical protein